MAETRLEGERRRAEAYMAPRTFSLVLGEAKDQLLKEMSQSLLYNASSGLVHMLRANQTENLRRMYALFSGADDLMGMPHVIFNHLKEMGKSIVTDSENEANPAQFVEELFAYKEKYDAILVEAFGNNRLIESQCNQAYQYVANWNPKTPEYLSLYLDSVLRKSAKEISQLDVETIFDISMSVFRLFHEKDVFENYYRQHLSKRLLNKRSASDDNELTFIRRLKDDCGFTFTSKMESMFNDMLMSGDLTREFKDAHPDGANLLDVSVSVLTTGVWPMKIHKSEVHLPQNCERARKVFEDFYLSRYAGRKLSWQANMGRAELKARFSSGEYEISASTLHMCILMLFNQHEALSTNSISELTGITGDELKPCLQALTCVKGKNVLTKSPAGKEVLLSDMFEVNHEFKSKTSKVKILSISTKRENDQERDVTKNQIVDDRKPQIEAAIMRVMKSKKRLDHNGVVLHVTAQVRNKFMPTTADIKKHIENLIDRDFIQRDPNDRKAYVYIA
jgi:cullin 3